MLDAAIIVDAIVALTLLTFSVSLVVATRRSGATLLLATFLLLVGVNIGATAIAQGMSHAGSVATSAFGLTREGWYVVAYIALALDPVYLLLFASAYPYRARSRVTWALVGASGATGLGLVGLLLVAPEPFLTRVFLGYPSWPFRIMIGNLAVAYVATWFIAVNRLARAPTRLLARQCRWLVLAVGIAVLPRLGFVPVEAGLLAPLTGRSYPSMPGFPYWILGVASFFAVLALVPHVRDRERLARLWPPVRIIVAAVAAFVALVALTEWAAVSEISLIARGREALRFGWRWVAFSGILAYGITVFDAIESRRAVTVVLPRAAGAIAAGGTALVAYASLADTWATADTLAGAALAGAAVALPVTLLARRVMIQIAPPGAEGDAARRLTLYHAAVESTLSFDAASRARDLRASRKALGVSAEEARVVEDLVRAAREDEHAPLVGEVLPGVVIERALGTAAHGSVHLASRPALGDRVVVKELALATGDVAARRRALREYRALANVYHPNLLRVLDVHVRHGRVLLVREFVPGRTLAEELATGAHGPALARRVARDVLAALAAAHDAGLVHRDVKPENVLVGEDGRVRLFDFDVALLAGVGPSATGSSTFASVDGLAPPALVGTPAYMAPEQARGDVATPASDLYAVGLVAREALTGRRGVEATRVQLPASWSAFFARALASDPTERYPDARAMAQAVPSGLEHEERAAHADQVAGVERERDVRLQ